MDTFTYLVYPNANTSAGTFCTTLVKSNAIQRNLPLTASSIAIV